MHIYAYNNPYNNMGQILSIPFVLIGIFFKGLPIHNPFFSFSPREIFFSYVNRKDERSPPSFSF